MSLPLRVYGAATALLEPFAPGVLRARAARGKEDPARLPELSVTASRNVVLSAESVPAKMIVCVPLVATENTMLNDAKLLLAGETRLPICVPSTVTLTGCTYGEMQHVRCAALNESV